MAVEIGELILSLRADASDLYEEMERAKADVGFFGEDVAAMLGDIDMKAFELPILSPKVDHRPLTELNVHLDKKEAHVLKLNRILKQNPIQPIVDDTELKQLSRNYGLDFQQKEIKVEVSIKKPRGDETVKGLDSLGDRIVKGFDDATLGINGDFSQAVGDAIKTASPKRGVLGSVGGALVQGAFEPVTAKFGKGLQAGLDQALSETIGSSELLGESLSKGILTSGEKLSETFSSIFDEVVKELPKPIQSALNAAKNRSTQLLENGIANLGEDLADLIGEIVGDDRRLMESMVVQGRLRSAEDARLNPARAEASNRRRDAFRNVEQQRSVLQEAQSSVTLQKGKISQGEGLEKAIESNIEDLKFQVQLADKDEVNGLNAQLEASQQELQDILGWIAQSRESLIEMEKSVVSAKSAYDESIESVKNVSAEFEQLKSPELPRIFREALALTTRGQSIPEPLIPRLVVDEETLQKRGSKATFDIDTNSVLVTQQMRDALDTGTATAEQIQTVLHELQHAFDFDFGSFQGLEALGRNELLRPNEAATPTAQEADELASFLEKYEPALREIEGNAELNARRLGKELSPNVLARSESAKIEAFAGVGANELKIQSKESLGGIFSQLEALTEIASQLNVGTDAIEGSKDRAKNLIPKIRQVDVRDVRTRGDSSEVLASLSPVVEIVDEIQDLSTQLTKAEISPKVAQVIPAFMNTLRRLGKSLEGQSIDTDAIDRYRENIKKIVKKTSTLQLEALATVGTDEFDESKIDSLFSVITILGQKISQISLLPSLESETKAISLRLNEIEKTANQEGVNFDAIGEIRSEFSELVKITVEDQKTALAQNVKPKDLAALGEALEKRIQRVKEIGESLDNLDSIVSKLDEAKSATSDLSSLQERVEFIGGDNDDLLTKISEFKDLSQKIERSVIKEAQAFKPPEREEVPESNNPFALPKPLDLPPIPDARKPETIRGIRKPAPKVGDDIFLALNDRIANLQSEADALLGPEVKIPLEFGEQVESVLADFGASAIEATTETVSAVSKAILRSGSETAETVKAIAKSEEAKEFAFKAGKAAQGIAKGTLNQANELGGRNTFALPSTGAIVPSSSGGIMQGGVNIAGGLVQGAKVAGGLLIAGGAKAADAMEFAAFSMVPGGAMIREPLKKGIQSVALPAATFAVASQLPAVAPVADLATAGMGHLVGPMMSQLSGSATEALMMGAQSAQAAIQGTIASSGVPGAGIAANVTGNALSTMTQPVIASATGAIEAVAEVATSGIAQVATAVVGGKVIQAGAGATAQKARADILKVLPSNQKALPAASPLTGTQTAEQLAIAASESVSPEALAADGLKRAKAIAAKFIENYKLFQKSLSSGDVALIDAHTQSLASMADLAKEEVNKIIETLKSQGVDVEFASGLGGRLNNVKSQLSRKKNLSLKASQKAIQKIDPDGLIEVRSQRLDRLFNEEGERFNTKVNRSGASPEQIEQLKELDAILRMMEQHADQADSAMEELDKRGWDNFTASTKGLNAEIERFSNILKNPIEALKDLEASASGMQIILQPLKGIGKSLAALGALGIITGLMDDFVKGSIDAAINLEKLENTFKFVTGSATAASAQIARIREESNTLGTDASQGLSGFAQLASATRGTSLQGAATEQLSSAVQQAASVSQLDAESLNRANTAISQIAGKGKLSAEELRQQLAEVGGVFSGSFQIAARAIGVTTAELDNMLQRGEVLSDEFLPKFAQQLAAETASGVAGASKTAQAAINRVNNQMTELREQFGAPLAGAKTSALNVGADLLERLVDLAPIASSLLVGVLGKLSIDAGGGLLQLAGGFNKNFGDIGLDKLEQTTFGDRVFDKAIEIGKVDVGDIATDQLRALGQQAEAAKTKFMDLKESASESISPFRGRTLGSISGDNLERGGIGPLSALRSTPAFGDISFDELSGKAEISSKTIQQRFSDSFELMKVRASVAKDSAIQSFGAMQASATTSAIAIQKRVATSAIAAGNSFKVMARNGVVGFLNISKAALAAGISLIKAMAPMLLLTAAFETVGIVKNAFSDLSGEVGDFADEAAKGFRAFEEAVAKANGTTQELAKTTRELGQGENFFSGSLVENLIGNGGGELLEKGLIRLISNSGAGFLGRMIGTEGIRTFAERQEDEKFIATNDLLQSTGESIAAVDNPEVKRAIAEVNALDEQISELRAQRRNIQDARQKEAIGQELDILMKSQEDAANVIDTLEVSQAKNRELLKQRIISLQDDISNATDAESAERFTRQLGIAKHELENIAGAQDRLANSIKAVVSASAQLNREFKLIRAESEDLRLDQSIDNANSRLEAALSSRGSGTQVRQRLQSNSEISDIETQIRINREEMRQIVTLLDDDRISESFDVVEFADPSQGANEILARLEEAKATNETEIIQAFAEETLQLKSLSAQTIDFEAQLVQARTDLNDQARDLAIQYRDLSQQISDFYRDALRSAEDVATQIVSQDFQNATQEISNDIRRELLGLEDSFVSGIGETFTGLIESLRSPLLDELNAINERNGIQRQFEDSLKGARDLQRQSDEFDFNAGFGPDPAAGLATPQSLSNPITTRVIELTAEQAFGGGSFLGEPSFENIEPAFSQSLETLPDLISSSATNIRNNDILNANDLAQRSRDEQLSAIDRNLATQASTASVEAQQAIASIARQLEEGRRTIDEQSIGFSRTLRGIGEGIGRSNPMRELESGLLAASDQFQDTNRDLERFKRGLQDTIEETSVVRRQLLDGVASGTVSNEALALLPQLDETINQSQAALAGADQQIARNRDLLNSQRSQLIQDFKEEDRRRRKDGQRRIVESQSDIDVAKIENARQSPFSLSEQRKQARNALVGQTQQESINIALDFDAQVSELQGLARTGELTKLEFAELKQNLIEVNEIRLDGLKRQFEELLPTVDAIASALGSTGQVNRDSFTQIQQNLRTSRSAGILSEEQFEEAQIGLFEARRLSSRSDAGAVRGLLETNNAFTSQFLAQAGRGDLTSLADIGIQNQQANEARRSLSSLNTSPEALANELTRPQLAQPNLSFNNFMQSSDRLVSSLDKLTTVIKDNGSSQNGRVTVQQQNVTVSRDEEEIARRSVEALNKFMSQRI